MIFYFAGADSGYLPTLIERGVENFLISFYGFKKDPAIYPGNLLVDSGGYTLRTRGGSIDVKDYADWLNQHKIKLAFNLDTSDPKETKKNYEYLTKNTDTYILPIYHYSDFIDPNHQNDIENYLEKPYIALGGVAGVSAKKHLTTFLDFVFSKTRDKVKVHGLGMTGEKLIQRYPFYSVDSTSWLGFSRWGNSDCNTPEMTFIKNKTKHWRDRTIEEIDHTLKKEKEITRLWEGRGIKWT